jgi:hydroxymethylglutaryl-CoA reductase (NADPH)
MDMAPIGLVPRMREQGYAPSDVVTRRVWLEQQLNLSLTAIGGQPIPTEEMRGNIENPVGIAQMPLGIAGPLLVRGAYANGVFYVPLATTEGALVRSYERGMVALTRAGGVLARIDRDENVVSPVLLFDDVPAAAEFAATVQDHLMMLRTEAESTTRHGRLLRIEARPTGRRVILSFFYSTADAQGMNMVVKATDRACRWLLTHSRARRYFIFSGLCSEKRASGVLLNGGKGKRVTAGASLPPDIVRAYLHVTPGEMVEVWRDSVIGHLHADASGFNAQYANGLAALFVACGQDVANVVNSSVGVTEFEVTPEGYLYASVTLPSLTVGTIGGGTGLGTSRECLQILGCAGTGGARKFAEVVAATLLAGELSMTAAIAGGEVVAAHERYGRNRPR